MFGELPNNDALMNPNVVSEELMFELERDFQYGWGSIWPYLSSLRTSYTAAKGVLEELKDVEDPMFYNLQNLDLHECDWRTQVEGHIRKIIWGALFTQRTILGPFILEGFYLAVEAGGIPTDRKNSIKIDLKKLTPTTLKVLLSGDAIMEAEEFLSHCNFLDTMDEECIQCFKDCIKEMTHMERSRLCKFVIGLNFFEAINHE